MRYAAKRTSPDRPKTWEQHGEAESLEAFALAFAADRGLGMGTEFEVIDKDSDDATLVGFRITGTDPLTLGNPGTREVEPVADRAADRTTDQTAEQHSGQAPPPAFVGSALGFFLYMAKVAVLILGGVAGLMFVLKYFNLTPPPG